MEYVNFGKTNCSISRISLGTWSYGGSYQSRGMSLGWAGQKESDSKKALLQAWDSGINHWDTADTYGDGQAESIIGTMWNDVMRKDIFLATKFGWDPGPYSHYYHPLHLRKKFDRSLKNLQVDHVDLLYLHHCDFGNNGEYFDDAMALLNQLKEAGKIRFIGLSDWSSKAIMKYIKQVNPDVVQPYRNVMDDPYEKSRLKNWIETNNVGVCFFSPLKHGLLTGKYTSPHTFPDGDFRQSIVAFQNQEILDKIQRNSQKLREKFPSVSDPVLHGIINALLTDSPTGSVLLGQRNTDQVNTAAMLGTPLSHEDAEWVKSLYR